jgi:tetratricopeptide (TPR) repeat protein
LMKSRLSERILILSVLTISLVGIAMLGVWRALGRAPSLGAVRALAREQRFSQAQTLLDRYLRVHPENARAQILMAEITTETTNSHPEIALRHLRTIHSDSPKQIALVRLLEGKAYHHLGRYDQAEASWKEALQLDPIVPEAGWALVLLLDKEGRVEEAHCLGMRLHEIETDPRDRVRILLEMSRLDIETPDPLSQVELFEPLVKQHPEHLPLTLMMGQAMIRVNRSEEGLKLLEDALRYHPLSLEAWDAWLNGLYHASEADRLAQEFARLPKEIAANPRFAKHQGMIAQITRDWPLAARAYACAFTFEPFNWSVCYRLRFVLRQAERTSEYERIDRLYAVYKLAYQEMRGSYFERFEPKEAAAFRGDDFSQLRGAYYETRSIKSLGLAPHPELYQRLGDLREKMGRFDEARAWHQLVLRDSPDNVLSLAALQRLK